MSQPALLSADEACSLDLSAHAQIPAAGIVSRTVLQTPELRLVHFSFDAGQELTSHTSRRRAVVHILSGACDFFFAGAWQRLAMGAILHLPPHHPHAVRAAAGPFTMLLTLASEPAPSS